jgi:outer membrane protein TolC
MITPRSLLSLITSLFAVLLGLTTVPPQASAQEATALSLAEVMEQAEDRGRVRAAEHQLEARAAEVRAARRSAWVPRIGVEATLSYKDQALENEFSLPSTLTSYLGDLGQAAGVPAPSIGGSQTIELESQRQFEFAAEVEQPLLNLDAQSGQVRAARASEEAASHSLERTRETAAAEAADLYFSVLALEARLDRTHALIERLEGQRDQIEALVESGAAIQSDRLRVEVAISEARLGVDELEAKLATTRELLGNSLGLDQPVKPSMNAEQAIAFLLSLDSDSSAQRPDLRALQTQQDATAFQQQAVRQSWAPDISLYGRYVFADGRSLTDRDWFEGGIRLRWSILEAGTRSVRADTFEAQADALEAQAEELSNAIQTQINRAQRERQTAQRAIQTRETSVEQATENLRVVRAQYEAGTLPLQSLLDANYTLAEQESELALAKIREAQAHTALLLAQGAIR